MPRFSTEDVTKNDPFRNFNFRILFDGKEVAACKKMSKLSASVDVVKFRAGNAQSPASELMPGRVTFDPVTFEAGLTNDKSFEEWATQLIAHEHVAGGTAVAKRSTTFRRTVTVRVLDIDNQTIVREYTLFNAWVSKYQALSDLVGDANDVLIESIEVQMEGFTRTQPTALV
jgi:phage tail-like protein